MVLQNMSVILQNSADFGSILLNDRSVGQHINNMFFAMGYRMLQGISKARQRFPASRRNGQRVNPRRSVRKSVTLLGHGVP
ncbi:hypothetical protein D1872_275270 [compost metagenome]